MSELADKLQSISEGMLQPMGFRPGRTISRGHSMLLIATSPPGEVRAMAEMAGGDIDAIMVETEDNDSLTELVEAAGNIPWGVMSDTMNRKRLEKLPKLGCDFLAFKAEQAPAMVLGEEAMGKILVAEHSLPDSLMAVVGQLPIDAVLIAEDVELPLTVSRLMDYHRVALITHKSLLAAVPSGIDEDDLRSLWDTGIDGVVVELKGEHAREQLLKLKETIAKFPPASKRRQQMTEITLPQVGIFTAFEDEDEEE